MERKEIIKQWLFIVILIGIPVIAFALYSTWYDQNQSLAYYGPTSKDANGEAVYHTIPEFSFTNQLGETVTSKDYEGKVYVANFFFAVCPSICPKMSNQLERVQEYFYKNENVKIISHSVDPVRDSVPVLAAYGEQYNADPSQWMLVTGDKAEIYKIARNGYMISALEGDGGPQDFIHSELFALVDDQGRIRGYYDGTKKEEVDKLMKDIQILLKAI